jgi:translation initiation factor 2B subunit (eIF-2B alpha/beta/delta family)
VDDAWATIEALADDDQGGAAEIAKQAADALPAIPANELPDAIETLLRGHPEMAPLWRLASDVLSESNRFAGASNFLSRMDEDHRAAELIAPILPDKVLTISYSSTVAQAIRSRVPREVLCMASDPGGEGNRMAEALADTTQASVIDDKKALKQVPAELVLIGADAITPTALINKVKTAQLAKAAADKGIACFVLAGESKFVSAELPVTEPFERCDLEVFAGIAAPMGLITPSEAASYAEGVELHQALRTLIERFDEGEPDEEEDASADDEEAVGAETPAE